MPAGDLKFSFIKNRKRKTFFSTFKKEIRRGDTITCPFCRKMISKDSRKEVEWILPNNTYALQMLKLNKQVSSNNAGSTV
jgi:hypothetical protein